ncbi:MAG: AAA family ATPase, partial [Bacteroidales bacterium]|nr:AAA family ATPase [Bacteroidales bacterium]
MGVSQFFESKIIENFRHEPTADQRALFGKLAEFVNGNQCNIMIIGGYAGTGKTSSMAAFIKTLRQFQHRYVLLAPTGRAAKVLSSFTGESAFTIHKRIYRQQSFAGGIGKFNLDINKTRDTFFIVDEASLITINGSGGNNIFGSGDLLEDFMTYIRSGAGNKVIFVGDRGQLPPIGMDESPALDVDFMQSAYGDVLTADLSDVVRQASESGILKNATIIRNAISKCPDGVHLSDLHLDISEFQDIESIKGGDLIESLSSSIDKYGLDNMVVLCRSNKRANRYNAGIRGTVLNREEQLNRGDKLMVVKNCYQFLEKVDDENFFIANGDVAELMKISKYEERYGLHFAKATLRFADYDDLEITAKIILDTLTSESAALTDSQQKMLFEGVSADCEDVKNKKDRYRLIREDKYFNALQIKYAAAITCHKSQGGQWPCVYIDNPFWQEDLSREDLKWLYTAITRGMEKV